MKLSQDTILHAVVVALREQVAPAIQDPFVEDVLRMAANQVSLVADAWDSAAALRINENQQMRTLFADSAGAVSDNGLAERLADAAQSSDPGYRISELDRENGRLRSLLVELHTHVETSASEPARVIERQIWRHLQAVEAQRAPR